MLAEPNKIPSLRREYEPSFANCWTEVVIGMVGIGVALQI
jgi:hypothetical protein